MREPALRDLPSEQPSDELPLLLVAARTPEPRIPPNCAWAGAPSPASASPAAANPDMRKQPLIIMHPPGWIIERPAPGDSRPCARDRKLRAVRATVNRARHIGRTIALINRALFPAARRARPWRRRRWARASRRAG